MLFLLKVVKVRFNTRQKRTRLLSDFFFFFTLEKRLISRVRVDLGLHEGVTEQ